MCRARCRAGRSNKARQANQSSLAMPLFSMAKDSVPFRTQIRRWAEPSHTYTWEIHRVSTSPNVWRVAQMISPSADQQQRSKKSVPTDSSRQLLTKKRQFVLPVTSSSGSRRYKQSVGILQDGEYHENAKLRVCGSSPPRLALE